MGADAAVGLESWREPERVVELARLAVARRAGRRSSRGRGGRCERLGGASAGEMLEMPSSASPRAVRERVARGRPVRYLVPEAVAELHRESKGLYA